MKQNYIKMNVNDSYLSLGNFIRVIKEFSKNKTAALQVEIFCVLFELDFIQTTTVNNYCVGVRSIGNSYKQHYIVLKGRYEKDKEVFISIFNRLLTIIEGRIISNQTIMQLNQEKSMIELSFKMYNIAKNDTNISNDFIKKGKQLLDSNDYYSFLVKVLFYIVLNHKQPLYIADLKRRKIEELLEDSYMGYKGVEDYIALKIKESVNYDFSLRKLAMEGNVLANYELGCNEYLGYVKGVPRYAKAFEYLSIAYQSNHAGAAYLIGHMLFNGMLGNRLDTDLEEAFYYLNKAKDLGNVAAINKLGIMYLQGIFPVQKDKKKAKNLFLEAAKKNYAYAFNNLGKIFEEEGDSNKAYFYYQKSASLKESWACNKMGEYYRNQKDYKMAFSFYQDATFANANSLCYYAYYNLAYYFYLFGRKEIGLESNLEKAIDFFNIASEHGIIEASLQLFFIYVNQYLKTKEETFLHLLKKYKLAIEIHPKYNKELNKKIESKMKEISNQPSISLEELLK